MANESLDLDAAKRLVADLAKNLEQISGDSAKLQELREEVQTLEGILNVPRTRHSWIADSLKAVESALHNAANEVMAGGVQVGVYVSEIGRILGMR